VELAAPRSRGAQAVSETVSHQLAGQLTDRLRTSPLFGGSGHSERPQQPRPRTCHSAGPRMVRACLAVGSVKSE